MLRSLARGLVVVGVGVAACGSPPEDATAAFPIVDGTTTFEHPSVGRLLFAPDHPQAFDVGCTATLIGCRTMLTAAHCFVHPGEADDDPALRPRAAYFQHAGLVPIERIDVNPDFATEGDATRQWRIHDVAVVTLARPPRGIRPSQLETGTPTGPFTAVGFGWAGSQDLPDHGLKRAGMASPEPCPPPLGDTQLLCWLGPAKLDSGDSGGPLLAAGAGEWRVAGVSALLWFLPELGEDLNVDMRVGANADFVRAIAGDDLDAGCDGPLVGDDGVEVTTAEGELSPGAPSATVDVDVPAGAATVTITANGQGAVLSSTPPDLDLFVEDGSGATACTDDSPGSVGACELAAPPPGRYRVRVALRGGSGESAYQVTTTTVGEAAPDDPPDDPPDGGCTVQAPARRGSSGVAMIAWVLAAMIGLRARRQL